jgi:hypothetical protein
MLVKYALKKIARWVGMYSHDLARGLPPVVRLTPGIPGTRTRHMLFTGLASTVNATNRAVCSACSGGL